MIIKFHGYPNHHRDIKSIRWLFRDYYRVIDEKLFFLSVIKYGMSFTVLDNIRKCREKKMIVKITSKDWGDNPQPIYTPSSTYAGIMGLQLIIGTFYNVIDKQKFFLAVLKYGFTYAIISPD